MVPRRDSMIHMNWRQMLWMATKRHSTTLNPKSLMIKKCRKLLPGCTTSIAVIPMQRTEIIKGLQRRIQTRWKDGLSLSRMLNPSSKEFGILLISRWNIRSALTRAISKNRIAHRSQKARFSNMIRLKRSQWIKSVVLIISMRNSSSRAPRLITESLMASRKLIRMTKSLNRRIRFALIKINLIFLGISQPTEMS